MPIGLDDVNLNAVSSAVVVGIAVEVPVARTRPERALLHRHKFHCHVASAPSAAHVDAKRERLAQSKEYLGGD